MTEQAPTVVVHPDAERLAHAVAARLVTHLVDLQHASPPSRRDRTSAPPSRREDAAVPSLVLTGGGIAERVYSALAASPARGAVDWTRVEWWWGDERFLPSGDTERNETQARGLLLDWLPVNPDLVHAMPSSDGTAGDDAGAAADMYAAALRDTAAGAGDHAEVPDFDVLLLGVGPDGHVASLFPGHPALDAAGTVVAVHEAPKPPPTRLSLTLPALLSAHEVWFVVSGTEKSGVVGAALSGREFAQLPAAAPRGRRRTLWLLDDDAATELR